MEVTAAPGRAAACALLALAGVLAVLGVLSDTPGRLLTFPAAAVALGLGLRDLLLVPVLEAGPDGLRVVQGAGRVELTWSEVRRLRVVTDRRAVLLELETTDERVLLLSRGRLGRDPRDVLDELEAVRP